MCCEQADPGALLYQQLMAGDGNECARSRGRHHSVRGVSGSLKSSQLLPLRGRDSRGGRVGSGSRQAAVISEGPGQEPGSGKLDLPLKAVASVFFRVWTQLIAA